MVKRLISLQALDELEAILTKTADTRKAMDRLLSARRELSEALDDLARLEWGS